MAAINEKSVKAHQAREQAGGRLVDAFLWDDELKGFGCKATAGGKRAFFVQYRPRGGGENIKRVHIGYYGKLTVVQARKEAQRLLGEANAGRDPQADRAKVKEAAKAERKAKEEKAAAGTLKTAIERFLATHEQPTRYWHEKRQRLLGSDLSAVHSAPVGDITRAQLKGVFDAVKARSHAPARLLFADLRPFFKWAIELELIDANPMAGMTPPKPAEKRERVLEPYEVTAFWNACECVSWPFASIFKLLLLTGARRDEVAGMNWAELDLDAGLWSLPGERTKNGRDHRVPLTPSAIGLLDRMGVAAIKAGLGYQDSDLVFSTTGTTPPSCWSKAKRALDNRMKATLGSRFKDWRLHDLRRTCATGMEDAGIATHIVETALNHVSGAKAGIVGVYQRAEHREAVRRAFELWERRVLAIVSGGDAGNSANVIPFAKAANI
jgi:integrase